MTIDAELFELVHRGTPGDVDFYRRVCSGVERILELGCGSGRVASKLAHAGRQVTGLELDPQALTLAARRKQSEALTLVQGDMRSFELDQKFEIIIVPFGGLYCLLSEADLSACLRAAHKHLVPGGIFAFDAYAADAFHAEADQERYLEEKLLVVVEALGDVIDVYESIWHRPSEQRVDATYAYRGRGSALNREIVVRQRYLLASAVESILIRFGFELMSLNGDFEGSSFDFESEQLVVVARARR